MIAWLPFVVRSAGIADRVDRYATQWERDYRGTVMREI